MTDGGTHTEPNASRPKRGNCDTCGETLRLLADGTIPTHKSPWNLRYVCKGSKRAPEATVDE